MITAVQVILPSRGRRFRVPDRGSVTPSALAGLSFYRFPLWRGKVGMGVEFGQWQRCIPTLTRPIANGCLSATLPHLWGGDSRPDGQPIRLSAVTRSHRL